MRLPQIGRRLVGVARRPAACAVEPAPPRPGQRTQGRVAARPADGRCLLARDRSSLGLIRNVVPTIDPGHFVPQSIDAGLKTRIGLRQSADVPANAGEPDLHCGEAIADLVQFGRQASTLASMRRRSISVRFSGSSATSSVSASAPYREPAILSDPGSALDYASTLTVGAVRKGDNLLSNCYFQRAGHCDEGRIAAGATED
jgi:hypothetical protein